MRLQAFLARAGAAPSRRKAEAPILAGRVTVNGETATLGATVTPEDEVELDGHPVRLPEACVYLALNKPAGYLTTMSDDRGRPTVAHLMPEVPGLVPVGRLDATTTGLLILTNDGGLAHRITHPSSQIEKQLPPHPRKPRPRQTPSQHWPPALPSKTARCTPRDLEPQPLQGDDHARPYHPRGP